LRSVHRSGESLMVKKIAFLPMLLGALGIAPCAAWADQKLYLKDGSYQLVSRYEVHGDRVRYYSVEGSQWEEIPAALVDLDATERARKEETTQQQKELQEAKQIEKERFERPAVDAGFEVTPGIHLPKEEGVFAFDGSRVIRMVESSAELVTDKKRAVLAKALPAPVLKSRSLAVLDGNKAAVRILVEQPTFFVQLPGGAGARVELMSVKPAKEVRVLERVEQSAAGGKASEVRSAIPLERTEIAPGLFKLRPTQPLSQGEYALGELVEDKLSLDVWDFGIGATAKATQPEPEPQNSSTMTEHPPASGDNPPVLHRGAPPPQPLPPNQSAPPPPQN
jgi:hypothetical protein